MGFYDSPTLNELQRTFRPNQKGESRLEADSADAKIARVTDAEFKRIVRERDRMRCRKCGRKVTVTMKRQPDRCEVHHLHGRRGVLLHEDRCALILCLEDHEKVTGRVNERWIVKGTKHLTIQTKQGPQTCIDARAKVIFERVA